jgi:DNA invertase Pin-like site-specific DNA recombinase
MNPKLTSEHLRRGAVVYVRQSTLGQVVHHTESQRRQYALAESARAMGFARVQVIDEDLGRSGSGLVERPGFQKLVASVCTDAVGAVWCVEASRLARNGRDWHHLIDLCALVGTLVIDPDGTYDPRLVNDRLLLGLKGTMSEYELSLLRQRGLAARDSKAKRGELRFALPPGYCWDELGRIEMDPDERVVEAIQMVFRKFRELGSARQVMLWTKEAALQQPVYKQSRHRIEWCSAAYHRVLSILQHPVYAGAYVFGRTEQRTHVADGRARKTVGHKKARGTWSVLLHDHHPGYISWEAFEENQQMLAENAHMQQRASRKSGRGGRALLTGIVRCGRCGRMMRVFYGSRAGHAHRYLCRGGADQSGGSGCIGIGGVRVDRAVAAQLIEAVSEHAVEAAVVAAGQVSAADDEVRCALAHEIEEARYEASLAARRHEAVDPSKRLVARELEARWNATLEQVAELEVRVAQLDRRVDVRPEVDRGALIALAHDLPAAWNAPGVQPQTKQRLTRVLIQEVVIDINEASNEAVVTIHWSGGRHTEIRVARVRVGRYPEDRHPGPVEVIRTLGGHWSDRQLAGTMNRMRCKATDGQSWTTVRVRELRERLGIAPFDPSVPREETISVDETARRLAICVGSVHRLIREGVLPATQLMASAPWQVPVAALDSEPVKIGVRAIVDRRPRNFEKLRDVKTLKLPGF